MPTQQEMQQAYQDAISGAEDPGAMVLPLGVIRDLASSDTVRPDVKNFLQGAAGEDDSRMVQLTANVIQFV